MAIRYLSGINVDSNTLFVDSTNNRVGIGTGSPSQPLHVIGNAWINRPSNKVDNNGATEFGSRVEFNNSFASNESGYMVFRYPSYNNFLIGGDYDGNIGGGIPNIQFGRSNGTVYMHIASSNGNVGIGTTSPTETLDLRGILRVSRSGVNDSGIIAFGNYVNGAGYYDNGIFRSSLNAITTSGNVLHMGSYDALAFTASANPLGSQAIRMYISGTSGNVGIGTTSPDNVLDLGAASQGRALTWDNYSNVFGAYSSGNLVLSQNFYGDTATDTYKTSLTASYGAAGILISGTAAGLNGVMRFYVDNATAKTAGAAFTPTERMQISGNGAIKFSTYGSGSFTGTATYGLAVDSSGNIIEVTSTIDGSGTANYVTKWQDVNTLTDSIIYDNGTNVGIGTTAPYAGTGVKSITVNASAYPTFALKVGDTFVGGVFGYSDHVDLYAEGYLNFETGGSEKMRITSAGDVGIGTTSPGAPLHVYKSDTYSAIISRADWNTSVPTKLALAKQYGVLGFISSDLVETTNDTSYIALNYKSGLTTYAEGLRVYNNGSVGIGTTAPVDQLAIGASSSVSGFSVGSGLTQVFLRYNNYFNVSNQVSDATKGTATIGIGRSSDGVVTFWTAAAGAGAPVERMRINNTGNVGINTTSPLNTLDVNGGSSFRDTLRIVSSGTDTVQLSWTSTNNGVVNVLNGGSVTTQIIGSGNTYFNGGNVGIGTNSPASKLQLSYTSASTTTVDNGLTILNDNGAENNFVGIRLSTYGDATGGLYPKQFIGAVRDANGAGQGDIVFLNRNAADTSVVSASDEVMRITNTAKVGIGTTSPSESSKLTLSSVGEFGIDITNSGTGGLSWQIGSTNNDYDAGGGKLIFTYANASSNSLLTIVQSNGNVGVGTNSPTRRLTVSQGTGANTNSYLSFNNSAERWVIGNEGGFNSGTSNDFIIYDTGYRLVVKAGGNVLIGTTTDNGDKLQVSGNTTINGSLYLRGGSRYIVGDGGDLFIDTENVAGRDLLLQTQSGQNVGIGTTSPGAKLDVNGEVYVSPNTAGKNTFVLTTNASNDGRLLIKSDTTTNVDIQANGTTYFNGGNVAIGTTTAATKLTVNSGSTVAASRFTNTTTGLDFILGTDGVQSQYTNIVFYSDSGNAQIWKAGSGYSSQGGASSLNIYNSNGAIAFHPNSVNNAMFINTSGNVGIGTTSPAGNAKLTIDGSAGANTSQIDMVGFNSTAKAHLGQFSNNTYLSTNYYYSGGQYNDTATLGQAAIVLSAGATTTSFIDFNLSDAGANNPSSKVRIAANGNVLIGTTTDAGYKLDVVTGADGNVMRLLAAAGNQTYFGFDSSGGYIETNGASTGRQKLRLQSYNGSAYTQLFIDGGNQRIYTSSNANVGIGTTNPLANLDVLGVIRYGNNAGSIGALSYDTTGLISLEASSANTSIAILPSGTGNVAIGSLTPNSYLSGTKGLSIYASANPAVGFANTSSYWLWYMGGSTLRMWNTTASEVLVAHTSGNVTIGSNLTDAGYKLDVYGECIVRDDIRILNTYALVLNGTDNNWRIGRNTISDSGWLTSNTMQMVVFGSSSGQGFQVVNHNGTALFEIDGVAGASRFTNALGVGVNPSGTAGRIDASNDIVAYSTSDQRLKENITPIANALDKVKALTGVEFDWKEDTKDVHGYEGHDVGVIAQEVQAVLPEAVRTNDSGYLSVRYEKMIALLVEANKELAARVEELENKLK